MDLMNLARINLREETETDLEQSVADFFAENKGIEADDVDSFATSLGLDPVEVNNAIYKLLNDFMAYGDWNKAGNPEVDPDELAMGIIVEEEHSINKIIQKRIAEDHLSECKDYYTRLAKMESECGEVEDEE